MRPSEFSDRIMGMNRVEERILRDRLKQIDREKRFSLSLLNREIRMIEKDFEAKQESLQALYNKEKLKILHENLHVVLLAKERLAEKIRLHNLRNQESKREEGEDEYRPMATSSRQTTSSSSLSDAPSVGGEERGRRKYVTRVHEIASATSARPKSNLSLTLSKRRPKSAKAAFNFVRASSSSSAASSISSASGKNAKQRQQQQQQSANLTQSTSSSLSFSSRSNNNNNTNRSQSSLSSARLSGESESRVIVRSSLSDQSNNNTSLNLIDEKNNNNNNENDFNRKLSELINANNTFLDDDSHQSTTQRDADKLNLLPSTHHQQQQQQRKNKSSHADESAGRRLSSMRRKSSSSNGEFYKFVSNTNKRDSTISLANKNNENNNKIHIQILDGTALDNQATNMSVRRQSNTNKPIINNNSNNQLRNRNSIARSSISDTTTTTLSNNANKNELIVNKLKLPAIAGLKETIPKIINNRRNK